MLLTVNHPSSRYYPQFSSRRPIDKGRVQYSYKSVYTKKYHHLISPCMNYSCMKINTLVTSVVLTPSLNIIFKIRYCQFNRESPNLITHRDTQRAVYFAFFVISYCQ